MKLLALFFIAAILACPPSCHGERGKELQPLLRLTSDVVANDNMAAVEHLQAKARDVSFKRQQKEDAISKITLKRREEKELKKAARLERRLERNMGKKGKQLTNEQRELARQTSKAMTETIANKINRGKKEKKENIKKRNKFKKENIVNNAAKKAKNKTKNAGTNAASNATNNATNQQENKAKKNDNKGKGRKTRQVEYERAASEDDNQSTSIPTSIPTSTEEGSSVIYNAISGENSSSIEESICDEAECLPGHVCEVIEGGTPFNYKCVCPHDFPYGRYCEYTENCKQTMKTGCEENGTFASHDICSNSSKCDRELMIGDEGCVKDYHYYCKEEIIKFLATGEGCLSDGLNLYFPSSINSPGYGSGTYKDNARCVWRIHADPHNDSGVNWVVRIEITSFLTEPVYDTLRIIDGGSEFDSTLLELSGYATPNVVYYTTSPEATIIFESDHEDNVFEGFNLSYSFEPACANRTWGQICEKVCQNQCLAREDTNVSGCVKNTGFCADDVVSDYSGQCGNSNIDLSGGLKTLTSPRYPYNYSPHSDCTWNVSSPNNTYITLDVYLLKLQRVQDFLEVYEEVGGLQLAYNLSGYVGPMYLELNSSQAQLRFKSDGESEVQGFSIDLNYTDKLPEKPIETTCSYAWLYYPADYSVTEPEGIIASPNYPKFYPSESFCIWAIKPENVSDGSIIELEIESFNTEGTFDFLIILGDVYGWVVSGDEDYRKINGSLKFNVVTPNQLILLFMSNSQVNSKGFKARYTVRE